MDALDIFFLVSWIVALAVLAFLVCLKVFAQPDAVLAVNRTDPNKDKYNFLVLCPLDDIPKKKCMIVRVKVEE